MGLLAWAIYGVFAALVALLFTWGVFLVVDPPEAGGIGPSFIAIATALASRVRSP